MGQVIAGGEDAEKFSYARRISELESARLLLDWVYGEKNRGVKVGTKAFGSSA